MKLLGLLLKMKLFWLLLRMRLLGVLLRMRLWGLGAIVDGGGGGGGIAEDETVADGAVCLAERGGLVGWDGYDVSVSIVASSRFGNNGSMGLGGWSWVGNNDCEWGKC